MEGSFSFDVQGNRCVYRKDKQTHYNKEIINNVLNVYKKKVLQGGCQAAEIQIQHVE